MTGTGNTQYSLLAKLLIIVFQLLEVEITRAAPTTLQDRSGIFGGPEVFLTISPLGNSKNSTDRKLVLNWYQLPHVSDGSRIVLLNEDPNLNISLSPLSVSKSILFSIQPKTPRGHAISTSRYPRKDLSATSFKASSCNGFWIAWISKDDKILLTNCMRVYPNWMNQIKDVIEQKPVHSLMIPGTHNSGSFVDKDWDRMTIVGLGILTNYLLNQDDSVYTQLIHGIRYLDLRAGYYPDTPEKFWINHNMFRIRPLVGVLSDVKRFVKETNEIVIVDFHLFPIGFDGKNTSTSVHEMLIQLVKNELGETLAKRREINGNNEGGVTIGDLWRLGTPVILGYAHGQSILRHEVLWPAVKHAWADTKDLRRLEAYLDSSHGGNGCQRKFWAAMAHLTFTLADILQKPNFGIRGFANLSNYEINEWYHRQSWYSKSMIVATDFYLSTNLIEMSFKVNKGNAGCIG